MYIYFTWDSYRKSMLLKQPKYYLKELIEDYLNITIKKLSKEDLINTYLNELWDLYTEDLSNM